MTNIFQYPYDARLKSWYELRKQIENSDIKEKCIKIDDFWQKTPLVNHYIHPQDMESWPSPWELIFDNEYCIYARALGMIYTLLLTGINDIDFIEAKDDNNEDVVLVTVDHAKYILNYWPGTVLNINLTDFKITRHIDISHIISKIGKL